MIVLGFFMLPIVAIFARVPPHLLFDQLRDPIVRDALVLTAVTNAIALAVMSSSARRRHICSAGGASAVARS